METFIFFTTIFTQELFLPYLWGMETKYAELNTSTEDCFYLTYEEWKQSNSNKLIISVIVFTLPMRNGNVLERSILYDPNKSFYLTYEEWKLCISSHTRCDDIVFTLPMRNGNLMIGSRWWQNKDMFLPYLWGMETLSPCFFECLCYWVFTLPMRNGNLYENTGIACPSKRFYLTYEEWKLNNGQGLRAQ